MTRATVHVTRVNAVRERLRVHPLLHVVMVAGGRSSVMHGSVRIRGALIHLDFTTVNACVRQSLTIFNPASLEAKMMKATTNHCVAHATTTRRLTMAAVAGVGRSESLGVRGWRPAGQSCIFTREIRQGGV